MTTPTATTPTTRRLTPELIASQRIAKDARISPDGRSVLFVVERPSTPVEPVQGRVHELWQVPSAGGAPVRVAAGLVDPTSPRWSPDGSRFGFLAAAAHGETAQVQVAEAPGGASPDGLGAASWPVRAITSEPAGASAIAWAPSGSSIAWLTEEVTDAGPAGGDPIVLGAVRRRGRLRVRDLGTGESVAVSPADVSVVEFAWAPDGRRLVAAITPDASLDAVINHARIAVIGLDGSVEERTAACGVTQYARWSPDGRWLAWIGSVAPNDSPGTSVFAAPAADGRPVNLTAAFAGSIIAIDWLPGEPATLVALAVEGTTFGIRTIRVEGGAVGELVLSEPRTVVGLPSISADGRTLAFTANRREHPDEVHAATLSGGRAGDLRRLTHLNPQLEGLALGEQSVISWHGQDGLELEGVLVKPLGYESGRRYPVLMYVHSGPEWVISDGWLGDFWAGWGQLLAADGVVTLYPNYRGGIGRGPAFGMLSCGDLGGGEFDDIVAGLEHLVGLGIADAERTAIGGGSWGGNLSAWGATAGSKHFRAAVAYASITNWLSMAGTSDSLLHEQVCHVGCTVEEDAARFLACSPVAHAGGTRTATLILHGERDTSCPVSQAYELDAVLRRQGTAPVETVIYPREPHHLNEPAHQVDLLTRVRGWILRHGAGLGG